MILCKNCALHFVLQLDLTYFNKFCIGEVSVRYNDAITLDWFLTSVLPFQGFNLMERPEKWQKWRDSYGYSYFFVI